MSTFFRFIRGRIFLSLLVFVLTVGLFVWLSLRLPRAVFPLSAIERIFALSVACAIAKSDLPPDTKIRILCLVLPVPWCGSFCSLIYLPRRRIAVNAPAEEVFSEEMRAWALMTQKDCGLAPAYADSVEYFRSGADMLPPFLDDLNRANRYVLMEYYIVAEGEILRELLPIFASLCKKGVKIYLFCDRFGSELKLSRRIRKSIEKTGVKFAFRGELSPLSARTYNRRNHRKCTVIDGKIAYTGGINLADEYFSRSFPFGEWKDTAVRICGEPALSFAEMIVSGGKDKALAAEMRLLVGKAEKDCATCSRSVSVSGCAKEDGADCDGGFGTRNDPPMDKKARAVPCIPFCDDPERKAVYLPLLLTVIGSAKKSVELFTPYLVPCEALFSALVRAAERGVRIRIAIPHVPDKKTAFLLSRYHALRLMACGVSVVEYTSGFLHAKSAVIDGKYAVVSSYNLDFRSLFSQQECGVLFAGETVRDVLNDFNAVWADGTVPKKLKWSEKAAVYPLLWAAPLF